MENRKYTDMIRVFVQAVARYPFRSLVFLAGTLLIGTTQVVSVGATFPILSTVTGNAGQDSQLIAMFNQVLVQLHLPVSLTGYIILFLCIGVLSRLIHVAVDLYQGLFIRLLEFNELNSLFKRAIGAKWPVLRSMSHGDFLNIIGRDVEQLIKVIKFDFHILSGAIQAVFFAGCALYINWRLSLLSFLLFGIGAATFYPLLKKRTKVGWECAEMHVKLNENLLNVARSFKNVKAGSLEERMQSFMKPVLYRAAHAYFRAGLLGNIQVKASELVGIIILSALLYVGFEVISIGFAQLALIFVIFVRMIPKIREVIDYFHQAAAHVASIWRINAFKERCTHQTRVSGKEISGNVNAISFNSVSFAYQENHLLLDNLDVEFKKGECWAICGESGVGKTTLLDLIAGIIEPIKGSISINGSDINELKLKSIHNRIGYLTQESFIFSGTLHDNLTWGNEDASPQKIEEAVDMAQLRALVNEKGLEHTITESGQNLSGGQRQRVAITRALLREYDFILLDEPTSPLDPETEQRFIASLMRWKGKIGIIMVTHRKEYLKYADYIMRFSDNKVSVDLPSCSSQYDGQAKATLEAETL